MALTIAPLIIWWRLADKKRLVEILFFGLLISIFTTVFDVVGSEIALWYYPDRFLPISPRLIPYDLSIIPVAYMLLYQYFNTWKSFCIAMAIFAGVSSFVVEPLFVWLDFYQPVRWKYIYSFPIYLGIGLGLRWVTKFFISKSEAKE